jgi:sugar phosphate isomerase/epimerase
MRGMTTRREFLSIVSTGIVASATGAWALAGDEPARPFSAGLALQLYSLRHRFKAGDVDGALALTRQWGLRHIEGNAPEGMSSQAFAAKLAAHELTAMGTGVDFGALDKDLGPAIAEAKALGAKYVMCAWIPHGKAFTLADVDKAAPLFDKAGKAFGDAGVTFMYHCHGYEFVPGPGGTLFDTLAARTNPDLVKFEMDVFWAVRGGADPVALLGKYPGRFKATHIKDIAKGTPLGDHSGGAPEETNVPLGQGQIDWPAVFRASAKAGVEWHIIEDESPSVERQVPVTMKYLAGLKL